MKLQTVALILTFCASAIALPTKTQQNDKRILPPWWGDDDEPTPSPTPSLIPPEPEGEVEPPLPLPDWSDLLPFAAESDNENDANVGQSSVPWKNRNDPRSWPVPFSDTEELPGLDDSPFEGLEDDGECTSGN